MLMPVLRPRVAVASNLSLVAEAVRLALTSRGYDTFVPAWPDSEPSRAAAARPRRDADAALVICDLTPAPRLRQALQLVAGWDHPWLLLTAASEGALWGALLEAGAATVLPSSLSLDEVSAALQDLLDGNAMVDPDARQEWIRQWHDLRAKENLLVARVQSLTPRERTVLRLLYAGKGVRAIAEELGVSEATVRSHVKSVLRKFRVSSQLDAVAVLRWLRDDPDHPEAWSERDEHGATP